MWICLYSHFRAVSPCLILMVTFLICQHSRQARGGFGHEECAHTAPQIRLQGCSWHPLQPDLTLRWTHGREEQPGQGNLRAAAGVGCCLSHRGCTGAAACAIAKQGDSSAEQEHALIDMLFKVKQHIPSFLLGMLTNRQVSHQQAVSKFGGKDMVKIWRSPRTPLSFSLPSPTIIHMHHPPQHADELLQMLLEQSALSLKKDLTSECNSVSLEQFHLYLKLLDFLCHKRVASESIQLLSFYWMPSLMGKDHTWESVLNHQFVLHHSSAMGPLCLWPATAESG
jgi:hypothetical protein